MTTEERAEVNQRALIDKVLARYSGEYTLFRELLQNADDAGASNVQIRFETAAYQQSGSGPSPAGPDSQPLPNVQVVQWTFMNDGKEFDNEDWKRLPRIAEGNPNPEKIGAFGVGFYSVFSVTDNPSVSSGKIELQFYWKEDDHQLYTRRHTFSESDQWTTFKMPLREPRPMTPISDFKRFLATSIIFMTNLMAVHVLIDDMEIGYIKRSLGSSRAINIPEELKRSTPGNTMHVEAVSSRRITIQAEISDIVCTGSGSKDSLSTGTSNSQVELTVYTAEVDVMADKKLAAELCRCTKKSLPPKLKYSLIYTGKDECDRHFGKQRNHHAEVTSIFQGLHADLEGAKHTRIFIGHATGQTTSIGGHMASRFIPTVEREAIDFVDKYVSVWNTELLHIGGFLCRVVYEEELAGINSSWQSIDKKDLVPEQLVKSRHDLDRRFVHVLKFFTFHDSAPSPKVAQVLRESFYNCSVSLCLLSSVGVRAAADIRAFDPQVFKFLNSIPMLSEHVSREAACHIDGLPDSYKISLVADADVLQALRRHPLSEEKLAFCLQWWLEMKRSGSTLRAVDLLDAVTFDGADGTPRPLSETTHFINIHGHGAHIPRDGPLPSSLIPLNISTRFIPTDLMKFGWKELTVMDWFQHISQEEVMKDELYNFTKSPNWAEHVLFTLSRGWSSLTDDMRHSVRATFKDTNCIPTSHGLRRPEESYLPLSSGTLLRKFGLAVVTFTGFEVSREMTSLLLFIGVQTHIPLDLLSDRMLCTGEWSITDFIVYLVQLPHPLSMGEVSKLTSSTFFFDDTAETPRRADELYPPVDNFRRLKLPVIKWNKESKWSDDSDEAKLLYRLGLHRYPHLKKIIDLCTSADASIREAAFTYFCENLRSKYSEYNAQNFQDVSFIPAENKEGACLRSPENVFLGTRWKVLGFSIIQNAFEKHVISELGIRQDPPSCELISLLENKPPCYEEAREWYECLSECAQTFTQPELARLSKLKMVPKTPGSHEWLVPTECYLGLPTNEFYSKLFAFVDFGPKANHFLSACGSMKEPSAKDIAERLIQDPDKFYELAGTHESFLEKLRDIATRKAYIPNETLNRMSLGRTLLGKHRKRENDQDEWDSSWDLQVPKEIVIVDDPRDYELFGDIIHVAPQDELLERFYSSLGCRRLSTVIQERYENSPAIPDDITCTEVRKLILQRLPSFLTKCSQHHYDHARVPKTDNFRVIVCERLLVRKTLIIGEDKTPRKQDLWAVAKYNSEEAVVELWLSFHAKRDIYDLAASLCRILFGTVKFTDTVLLGAMLSDLELLKRAGFDVGQFNEHESMGAEPAKTDTVATGNTQSPANLPAEPRGSAVQSALEQIRCSIVKNARGAYHTVKGSFTSNGRRKLSPFDRTNNSGSVVHRSYIDDIVNKATRACSPGCNQLLDDNDEVVQFLRYQSCNDFAQVDNLRPLGITPSGVQVHVVGDDPDICAFILRKQELLARFIRIISPAVSAHKLLIESLHVFYVVGEGPIAFNSDGSIYLNLRCFEEWHDDDVQKGGLRQAQLSWFLVLAHEIAHNLIPSHDAAHTFWFSAICEKHMSEFLATIECC